MHSPHFSSDGFETAADVLPLLQCRDVAHEISELANHRGLPGGRAGHRDLLRFSSIAREVAGSQPVRNAIESVLGDSAVAVKAIWFDKHAGANWNVGWHQDVMIAVRAKCEVAGYNAWSNKQGVPHVLAPQEVLLRMATLRINIDSTQQDNGPLMVLPGTHAWGVLDSERVREFVSNVAPVSCLTPAGGAVVMSPLLLHSSAKSTSQRHRRVLHFEFANFELPRPLEWRDRVAP